MHAGTAGTVSPFTRVRVRGGVWWKCSVLARVQCVPPIFSSWKIIILYFLKAAFGIFFSSPFTFAKRKRKPAVLALVALIVPQWLFRREHFAIFQLLTIFYFIQGTKSPFPSKRLELCDILSALLAWIIAHAVSQFAEERNKAKSYIIPFCKVKLSPVTARTIAQIQQGFVLHEPRTVPLIRGTVCFS